MRDPDENNSAQAFVKAQWQIIQNNKSRHFIASPVRRSIDEFIDIRQRAIDENALDHAVDWKKDLFLAKIQHKYFIDFAEKVELEHKAYVDHWKTVCSNGIAAGEKLSLAGLNTIYLVHGAVAVGSLNALANKVVTQTGGVASAAKFAMPSALAGIGMVGIGQIILAKFGTEMSTRVAGKLIGTVTHRRSRSFSRYWLKYQKRVLRWGDYLVYASVAWFFVYSMISYLILIND